MLKNCYLHFEGIDKSGKSTLLKEFVKKFEGKVVCYDRSIISQISYSRIYDRNIDEEFYIDEVRNLVRTGNHLFIHIKCDYQDFYKRFHKHHEKDLKLHDYKLHHQTFNEVFNDIFCINEDYIIIDTTRISIPKLITKYEKIIINWFSRCHS